MILLHTKETKTYDNKRRITILSCVWGHSHQSNQTNWMVKSWLAEIVFNPFYSLTFPATDILHVF